MEIYVAATGCSGILQATHSMEYGSPTASVEVQCTNFSGTLNDTLALDIGSKSSHQQVFTGRVKSIIERRSKGGWHKVIRAHDELILASDYFIAADDPENPYEVENIAAETLVVALLNMASITSISYTSPGLTLAVTGPYKIDRVYVMDMVMKVAAMAGYHIWTSKNGTVNFKKLDPTPGTPSHSLTVGNSGELIELSRTLSEENLRNRVVAYGSYNLKSVASASSPYLPDGFYKTAVISHPIMDTQAAVDFCAAQNLAIMNKPTQSVECMLVGDTSIEFGQTVTVTETKTQTSGDWFVYSVTHSIGPQGFITSLGLRK